MTSGKLPEGERRNKQAGFAYAIQTFRGSHSAARELVREIEADIRNRVLGDGVEAVAKFGMEQAEGKYYRDGDWENLTQQERDRRMGPIRNIVVRALDSAGIGEER